MHLSQLDIRQLPGIDPITLNELSPGINFIVGPNAIGKSSLIRALHYVLAEARPHDPSALSISATLQAESHTWIASRNGPHTSWEKDTKSVDRPALPPAETLHCYWLRAETLIAPAQEDSEALSQRLRQALAGGVNLENVRKTAGLNSPGFPARQYSEWQEAKRGQALTERQYQALDTQRDQLPVLKTKRAAAQQARDELERLHAISRLREAIDERVSLEAYLTEFPSEISQLSGREGEQADALEKDQQAIDQAQTELSMERQQNAEQIKSVGFSGEPPASPEISAARDRLEALRTRIQEKNHAADALARANAEVQDAVSTLGQPPKDPLPRFTPAQIDAVTEALRERNEARSWQARTATSLQHHSAGVSVTLGLGVLAAGSAALAGMITANWMAIGGGLGAMMTSLIAWLLLRLQTSSQTPTTHSAVADAQAKLEATLTELGLDQCDLQGMGLPRFMEIYAQIERAHIDAVREQARVDQTDHAIATETEALCKQLQAYIALPSTDVAALRAAIDDLADRAQQRQTLEQTRDTLNQRKQAIDQRQKDNKQAREALYRQQGLTPDKRPELDALLARFGQYQQATAALERARLAEKQLQAPLQRTPESITWAETATPDEIASAVQTATDQSNELDRLTTEIAELEASLAHIGGDGALAAAIARVNELEAGLDERRDQHLKAHLGDWLLTGIEKIYREKHEPGLIQEARMRFETFTQSQWSLEVDADHQLVARDLRRNAQRPLSDLSSGTRMQLLLAAQLAWARDQEQGQSPLPLALDEALTHTDPERFAQVVKSIESLSAQEGRQILYLTARGEDLALWAEVAGYTPHTIDLAVLRGLTDQATRLPPPPPVPATPAPQGEDPSTYAKRLGVSAIHLTSDVRRIHLFYLLRDALETLHWLLDTWGLAQLGPLERWLQSPAGRAIIANDSRAGSLTDRIEITHAWHALAQQGRGQPVDRAVLEQADVLSEKMLDRVANLATTYQGNAQALIKALDDRELPALRISYINNLRRWLTDHGYLDTRPLLSESAITTRLLGELGHRIEPAMIRSLSASLAAGAEPALPVST
jgi:DNA repair exonuclease SbcCD ATPase subunit